MYGGYWSPMSAAGGVSASFLMSGVSFNIELMKQMSPYYSGGLGIPYMMGMGGMGTFTLRHVYMLAAYNLFAA